MRDLIAGVIAVALLLVAASLATTLQFYRRRRQRTRDAEGALGRTDRRGDSRRRRPRALQRRREAVLLRRPLDRQRPDCRRARPDQRLAHCGVRLAAQRAARRRRRRPASRIGRKGSRAIAGTSRLRPPRVRRSDPMRRHPRTRLAGAGARGVRCGEARHGASDHGEFGYLVIRLFGYWSRMNHQ